MSPSLAAAVELRLNQYRQAFQLCVQGEFSLGRFLALLPDRLPVLESDGLGRAVVRVFADPVLARTLAGCWPIEARGPTVSTGEELRRVLRLAQQDPELDPLPLVEWSRRGLPQLLEALGQVYRRALGEVGRGEGGEELAYVLHLALLGHVGSLLEGHRERIALLDYALPLAVLGAAESLPRGDTLSTRLGLRIALTTSARGLSRVSSPAPYRTTTELVALAEGILEEPVEGVDLGRVERALVERVKVDPGWRQRLGAELLVERMRETLMVLALQAPNPPELVRALLHEPRRLRQTLGNSPRRDELARVLSAGSDGRARQVALELLPKIAAALRGADDIVDAIDLERRARLAAQGAMVLALDGRVEDWKRPILRTLRFEPEATFRAGQAYLLSSGEGPTYLPRADAEVGVLVLDLRSTSRLVLAHGVQRYAPVLEQTVLTPLRRELERRPALQLSLHDEVVVVSGDALALFEIAPRIQSLLTSGLKLTADALSPSLGGERERQVELDAEIARLSQQLATLDDALVRSGEAPERHALLQDGRALLTRELALLEASRLSSAPAAEPLETGLYLGFGLSMAGPLGLSEAVLEGLAATSRSEAGQRQRRLRLERAEKTRGRRLEHAFQAERVEGEQRPYNAGFVVSARALEAYRRASRGLLVFEARTTQPDQLPREALGRRFAWDERPETWVAITRQGTQDLVALLRDLGPFSVGRELHLYELLQPDHPWVVTLTAPSNTDR